MAEMVARIRVVLDVPFSYEIPEPQFQPVRDFAEGDPRRAPGEEMINENQRNMARIDAAKHAESNLVQKLKDVLGDHGTVVDELVEEVRDAEVST